MADGFGIDMNENAYQTPTYGGVGVGMNDTGYQNQAPASSVPNFGAMAPSFGGAGQPFVNPFAPVQTPASTPAPTPTYTPPAQTAAPAPTSQPANMVDPMSFFRTDYSPTYNLQQYANQAGISRVQSFLPGSQQTQTATAFGPPPQAITNYNGVNMNTGLINNLINQYGEEQARRMLDDEVKFAQQNGGAKFGLNNDASLVGYNLRDADINRLIGTPASAAPAPAPVSFNPANYVAPPAQTPATSNANTAGNGAVNTNTNAAPAASNTPATAAANNGQFDMNQFFTLMMALLMGGGLGGQQTPAAAQRTGPTSRNPLWYSNYY